MTKPLYSAEEIFQLISLVELTKDLIDINKIIDEDRKLYSMDDFIKMRKLSIMKYLQLINKKGCIQIVVVAPTEKCEACGAINSMLDENCKECKCQL